MREENFQTTLGLNNKASKILWDIVCKACDAPKVKTRLFIYFQKYMSNLKSVSKSENYDYLSKLIINDFASRMHPFIPPFIIDDEGNSHSIKSYVLNCLKTLRKTMGKGVVA